MADINISAYPWLCDPTDKLLNNISDADNIICDNEKETYDNIIMDTYGMYGIKCIYYHVSEDILRDKLFGEDQLRIVSRSWYFDGYIEQIPPNVRSYQLQGIWGEDTVKLYTSIGAFNYFSTYGGTDKNTPEVYESLPPMIGDIIYIPANDYFYEIRDVKYYSEPFGLQRHTYTLTLKMYRDEKWTIDTTSPTLSDPNDPIYKVVPSALNKTEKTTDHIAINNDLTSAYDGKVSYLPDMEYKYYEAKTEDKYYNPFDGW